MRAEEQLEAEEEEQVSEIAQDLDEGRVDQAADEQAKEDLPHAARHFNEVVLSMREVLEGRALNVEEVSVLSFQEKRAFEALQQVVSGRGRRGGFLYAETRMQQLNQVLSLLQPALSIGSIPGMEEMRGQLALVIDEVSDLRDRLNSLDAAEEELAPVPEDRDAEGDKDDDDDDDEGAPAVPELGAPPRPSTLAAGPSVPDKVAPPSTLSTGPAAPERAAAPTSLTGSPPAPELPMRPTTLTGGPEAPDVEPSPSTLAEASDEAGAPKPTRGRKVK